jgi:uncharacterized membrane protein
MGAFVNSVFEFLFKYRPVVFERGDFEFGAPWPLLVLLLLGLLLAGIPLLTYLRARGRIGAVDRAALLTLRVAVLAVLLFCLARPILVLATVVPLENFLGILVDDSRSMQIADDGTVRGDFVLDELDPDGGELLNALAERFKLRFFRFSDAVDRVASVENLAFSGRHTRLGDALTRVHGELSAVPLAGLVVVSDGADNSDRPISDAILQLRGSGIPVHTIGLGRERFDRDIEVSRIELPRAVLTGSSVAVEVMVVHSGFQGETVTLNVEDAGRILSTQEVTLPREGEVTTVRAHFTAAESGPRLYRFHIVPQQGELVIENNTREALVQVRDRREKILYFEGEPRFEVKFLRRAIAEDDNLQVVTLQRTAENKFLRLDVDDVDELLGGFPKTREELFQYRALILGSIEASFFTHDQLQAIAEFVGQRGGGLLMLGGRRAFAEGGYADTPVAGVLPVVLSQASDVEGEPFFREVNVRLTPFGRTHPITQIEGSPDESAARWLELPPVSTLNPITETKPGASTLLMGESDGMNGLVVLAAQRYGRGRVLAFPVQDSWLWQMHADVPLDDLAHETFWRQLLRWLVQSVPDQIAFTMPRDHAGIADEMTITAEVVDSTYLKVNDAAVVARVTSPSGATQEIPMEWVVERDGEYLAGFATEEEGLYEVRTDVARGGEQLGSQTTYVQVTDPMDEYFGAQMKSSLLRRLAEETGGQFYTPETVRSLPEDVRYTESGSTVYEELEIWDMPVVFLLLVGLLATEWGLRKARGLV